MDHCVHELLVAYTIHSVKYELVLNKVIKILLENSVDFLVIFTFDVKL